MSEAVAAWSHAYGEISLDRPRVMGVVNLTPDSFSDGGKLMVEGIDAPNASVAVMRPPRPSERTAPLFPDPAAVCPGRLLRAPASGVQVYPQDRIR